MIIAVITALSAMEAAGGLDYLVTLAERIMRRHPQYITFVAPVVTYLLVFASGTTHVIYALLPIMAEVAARPTSVRSGRCPSASWRAFRVHASPISAATVAMFGVLAAKGVSLPAMLAVTIPSTFIAVLIGALFGRLAWAQAQRGPQVVQRTSRDRRGQASGGAVGASGAALETRAARPGCSWPASRSSC